MSNKKQTMEEFLVSIIGDFAKNGFVFSNEQDFQFQLALALKNNKYKITDNKTINIQNVFLEVPSFNEDIEKTIDKLKKKKAKKDNKKTNIKEYTDIIIELTDGKNVFYNAIELKYKTSYTPFIYKTKSGESLVMGQGAYDIGSYLYIKDIFRLEDINNRYFAKKMNITKCYAILLTNEKHYRNGFKSDIWSKCNLKEDATLENTISLNLSDDNRDKYKSYQPISLLGKYELKNKWHDYSLTVSNDAPNFSFLIVEITPKQKSN